MITVAIPVGPSEANRKWLPEAVESAKNQTHKPDQILLIDDMAGLEKSDYPGVDIWYSPWRLGVAHAFNFGVALARNPLVFMLGSDDFLDGDCLDLCIKAWQEENKRDAYYYVGVRYLDDREFKEQNLPCGAAMVTKGAWQKTGGFATESAVGTSDANFISTMLVHNVIPLIPVAGGKVLYNYRPHAGSDTAERHSWQGVILETRNLLTAQWKKPEWGRYESDNLWRENGKARRISVYPS